MESFSPSLAPEKVSRTRLTALSLDKSLFLCMRPSSGCHRVMSLTLTRIQLATASLVAFGYFRCYRSCQSFSLCALTERFTLPDLDCAIIICHSGHITRHSGQRTRSVSAETYKSPLVAHLWLNCLGGDDLTTRVAGRCFGGSHNHRVIAIICCPCHTEPRCRDGSQRSGYQSQ